MSNTPHQTKFLAIALFTAVLASCGGSEQPNYPTSTGTTTGGTGTGTTDPNGTMGGGTAGNPNGSAACNSNDTWNSYAEGFFATSCAPCHGAGKTPGTSFYDPNSYTSVAGADSSIAAAISSGKMPLNATLDAADKARILAWLGCNPPPQK